MTSNTFVTARHCFYHKDKVGGSLIKSQQDNVTLSILAEPTKRYELQKVFINSDCDVPVQGTFHDAEDFLFLTTSHVGIEMPSVTAKRPAVSRKLLLLGYFRFYQSEWVFGDPTSRGLRENWSYGMRWTKAPLCRIGPIKDSCLSHFCQSDLGFSGSAMLAPGMESAIGYYGIHIGTMSIEGMACHVGTSSTAGNMGIRIDVSAITKTRLSNTSETQQ